MPRFDLNAEQENIRKMISSIDQLPEPITEEKKSSLKQDLELLKHILIKSNLKQTINTQASNFDQFMILRNNLLEQLKKVATDLPAPAEGEAAQKDITEFKNSLKQFEETQLPSYAKMIQGVISVDLKNIEKILPHLKWIPGAGGKAKFHSPEGLAEFIGDFCAYMKKTNNQNVNFTIHLPPPSEQEQKKLKGNPNARIHQYAKKAFEAAARQGYDPSHVKLNIDNKIINYNDEAFKAELPEWQNMAKKTNASRLENTRGSLKAEPFSANDTVASLKPKSEQEQIEDATHSDQVSTLPGPRPQ